LLGDIDVGLLAFLGPSGEQDDKGVAVLAEVNPIAWAKVESLLQNASAHALGGRDSATETVKRDGDSSPGCVFRIFVPLLEKIAAEPFDKRLQFDPARNGSINDTKLRIYGVQEMTSEDTSTRQSATKDSAITLAALGILAYAASMMTHEALGHGGYCLAVGGHTTMLTPWAETCHFPGAPALGIKAAGPGVQFGMGLLAWLTLRVLPRGLARLRFFLWLCMVFNMFVSSGYIAFSGVTGFGDAAEVIARLHPAMVWRGGLIVVGAAVYYMAMVAAALELKRFVGQDDESRRLFRLVWIPYAAVGVFACSTAAMSRMLGHGDALGLAVASSFGAGWGMFRLPDMIRGMAMQRPSPTVYVNWSAAWGVAAAAVIVAFLFLIGPGLG
jgi:hypothetical protein